MTTELQRRLATPIPDRMKHLKKDARGYPIPYGVYTDQGGYPHFAMNVEETRIRCLKEDLCPVCGSKLFRGRWFVGGAGSAFHNHGAFIDPPMHSECAHYALQVCPYVAAPNYAKEMGLLKAKHRAEHLDNMICVDNTAIPGRPTGDMFVAVMSIGQIVFENFNCKPKQPYRIVQFWRHGQRIDDAEGYRIVSRAIAELS